MADTKISALTDGGDIATNDVIPVVRGGANRKVAYAGTLTATMPFSGARVELASTISGTNGDLVPIPFGTSDEKFDTDSYLDDVNDRIVIPAGVTKVLIGYNLQFDVINAETDRPVVRFNHYDSGDNQIGWVAGMRVELQAGDGWFSAAELVDVAEGDYFELSVETRDTSWDLNGQSAGASRSSWWVKAEEGSILDITITL